MCKYITNKKYKQIIDANVETCIIYGRISGDWEHFYLLRYKKEK